MALSLGRVMPENELGIIVIQDRKHLSTSTSSTSSTSTTPRLASPIAGGVQAAAAGA